MVVFPSNLRQSNINPFWRNLPQRVFHKVLRKISSWQKTKKTTKKKIRNHEENQTKKVFYTLELSDLNIKQIRFNCFMKSKSLEYMSKEQTLDKEPNKNTMMFTYPQLNKTQAIQPVKNVNNTFPYINNCLIWSVLFSEEEFLFVLSYE